MIGSLELPLTPSAAPPPTHATPRPRPRPRPPPRPCPRDPVADAVGPAERESRSAFGGVNLPVPAAAADNASSSSSPSSARWYLDAPAAPAARCGCFLLGPSAGGSSASASRSTYSGSSSGIRLLLEVAAAATGPGACGRVGAGGSLGRRAAFASSSSSIC